MLSVAAARGLPARLPWRDCARAASIVAAPPSRGARGNRSTSSARRSNSRRQRGNSVVVFASELAALTGHNPYQKPSEVMPAVIKRCFPDLEEAITLSGMRTVEEAEEELLSKSEHIAAIAAEATQGAATAADAADLDTVRSRAVADVQASAGFAELPQGEQDKVKEVIGSRVARQFGTVQETKAIGRKESDDLWAATRVAVESSISALKIASPQQEQVLRDAVLVDVGRVASGAFDGSDVSAGDVADRADTISRDVLASVERVVKERQAESGVGEQVLEAFQATQLPVLAQAVRGAAEQGKVRQDTKWRDKVVGRTRLSDLPIVVGGRVDGYNGSDGTLLEVKNRTRRLFNKIVGYENVQLHAYMFILGLDHCQLLERMKRDHDESRVHDVDFDPAFWDGVMGRLTMVADGIDAFTRNGDGLREYGALKGEKDKQAFLKHAVQQHLANAAPR